MKTCWFLCLFVLASGQESCDLPCPYHLDPVCGTDGVTYPNLCSLQVADCLSDEDITLDHPGECQAPCNDGCPFNYDPVCGSDGVTYPNLCSLQVADCLSNDDITLAYPGECQAKREACDVICPANYDPVCGSDGVTYPNLCTLQAADCLSDGDITLAHPGECQDPCNDGCPFNYDPVCGSDGVTYPNLCSLQVADCLSDDDITLAYPGECQAKREACDVICPANYDPVCGSDGVTYPNVCTLQAADCLSDGDITLLYPGECKDDSCNLACPDNYDPVCGSDGVTYPNLCDLEHAACLADQDITLAHTGPC